MEHWYSLAESLDFRLFTFSSVNPRIIRFGLNKKLKKLRAYAEKYPELRAEYEAKIEDITGLKEQSRDPDVVAHQRAEVARELDALDAVLAQDPYIAGEAYSLADVIWTVSLTRLWFLKQHALLEDRPHLLAYFRRMQARPSYEEATLYPHFKIGPMLPLMTRLLGPKLLMAGGVLAALVLLWTVLT
jgi:tetrachloro-p-hydroquinone reductive dehalogenase